MRVTLGRKQRLILFYCANGGVGYWRCSWGFVKALWIFDATPGATGRPAAVWPADTNLDRDHGGVTLVMSVHPKCACTVAGIAELARVVARAGRSMRVYVLAVIPDAASANDWRHTALLARARRDSRRARGQ